MSGTISPKLAVNTNNNDAYHYLDVVIPSSDTCNSINIANTFQSNPVFYSDKYGNVSLNGTLTCAQLNIQNTGISLPTTYSVLPGPTDLGYIQTVVPSQNISMTYNTNNTICSATIPTGVWIMSGNTAFNTSSSLPNTSLQSIQLYIGPSSANGSMPLFDCYPIGNYTLGPTNASTLYMSCTAAYINGSSQTYYLVARVWASSNATTLQVTASNTMMKAIRIG